MVQTIKDLQNIDLDFLRQSLSIVPQETFIIEGTLRDNIDPLNIYKDEDIIKILNDFSLFKDLNDKEKLNLVIKEAGKRIKIQI